jgi:hypothetical protein
LLTVTVTIMLNYNARSVPCIPRTERALYSVELLDTHCEFANPAVRDCKLIDDLLDTLTITVTLEGHVYEFVEYVTVTHRQDTRPSV